MSRPKEFWSQIKRCYPTKSSKGNNCKLFEINGKRETNIKVISNAFCTFFTQIGKTLRDSLPSLVSPIWKNHDHGDIRRTLNPGGCIFKFTTTSREEIHEILRKLKRKKALGYDDIPVSLIIDGAAQISGPLSSLINRCLRQSVFPSAEKWAKVTPVYKSGERSLMDNYRPISVLPVLSKVFERVVYQQLYSYLEEYELLSQRQFGFRNKSSTQHAVNLFSNCIRQGMDRGLLTGAVFVDLRKAYDTVDHSRVLSKLPLYGINVSIYPYMELKWFESYLFDRKQFVQFDGVKSATQSVFCGVPQGSILGPLLFTLLINDIDLQLNHCEIILYADDAVIYCVHKTCDIIESQLNTDIDQVAHWLAKNNLVANLKRTKTECVLFGTSQRPSKSAPLEIKMNGHSITESKNYEYLGVTLDKNLNFNEHLEKTFKKISSRIKLLSRVRQNISPYTAETIYKVMILPVMLYCSNVFVGMTQSKKQRFETFEDRAMRIINGNRKSDVKLPLINHLRKRLCALEVFKCLNGIVPKAFENYFTRNSHKMNTRNNNKSVVIPKVRTEAGRKTFSFQGARYLITYPTTCKLKHHF